MENQNRIEELISRWPNRKAFADQIGAPVETVHKWARRGAIPSAWQFAVQAAAEKNGHADITPEWMLVVHAGEAKAS